MTETLLLPCPFCGDVPVNPEFDEGGGGPPPRRMLRCDGCGATGPFGHGKAHSDYEGASLDACAQWNTRALTASAEPVGRVLSEEQYDGVRALIAGAFEAGATAVQENYEEMSDPDFTEAALDYTHGVTVDLLNLFPSVTPTPDPAPNREAVARAICLVQGYDPDDVDTQQSIRVVDNDGQRLPMWESFTEEADAVLALFSATQAPPVVQVTK